jgi:DNA modification methylase
MSGKHQKKGNMDIKIVNVKIEDLIPASYNPRKSSKEQNETLKTSLEKFGFVDPIIANSNPERMNTIIGGHFRWRTAKEMGFKECPVVYVDIADIEKEKELNIRLNKNTGEFDFNLLKDFDKGLLADVGFSSEELDKIFPVLADDKDDEVPEVNEETTTKIGDIFQLGRHRVMCGDSTDAGAVAVLMDNKLADVVVTDPPYNTGMEAKPEDAKARLSHMFKDNFTPEEWIKFLDGAFNNYLSSTKCECAFYVFIDWRRVGDIRLELEKRMDVKNVIVWDKGVHGLGSDYKSTYELCIVGKRGKPQINNRFGLDYQDIWRVRRAMGRNKEHATAKPIELLTKPIIHASKQDDICLDLFLGSGSTLIACEKTNRICYGMEIDPHYVDVIVKRWEEFTGQKAIRLSDN